MKATIMAAIELFPKVMQGSLSIGLGLILASCGTVPYQQTYLTSSALSGISKISVAASANELEVKYTISTGMGTAPVMIMLLSPLLVFPAAGIEASAKAGKDRGIAREIGNQIDLHEIEEEMAQVFITALSKDDSLGRPRYIHDKGHDERKLIDDGYDAVIKLAASNIALERVFGDSVDLHIRVSGSLKSLKSGKIIWDREEDVLSPVAYSLDYYKDKDNFMKELKRLLHKAVQNLSYDFKYLKQGGRTDEARSLRIVLFDSARHNNHLVTFKSVYMGTV
jgi:hypothetical protein